MTMPVEASCGVAIAPVDGDSADLLLQRADVAMYVAKDSHASIVTYNDELNINTPARLALLSELRAAVSRRPVRLCTTSPRPALGGRNVHGVEALVRWQHPTLRPRPAERLHPAGRAHRAHQTPHHLGAQHGSRAAQPLAGNER